MNSTLCHQISPEKEDGGARLDILNYTEPQKKSSTKTPNPSKLNSNVIQNLFFTHAVGSQSDIPASYKQEDSKIQAYNCQGTLYPWPVYSS